MKISLNWLREYTSINLSVDELVEKIGAQLGEVEESIDFGKKYEGLTIVKVVECRPHPNADKLKLCKIDTGKKQVQVACGAPNVREGMLAVWLAPGTIVPATYGKEPLKLEVREIRGELSNGMLASPHELAISDDHSGILEVTKGRVGDDFAKTYGLDDFIIDIENKMFTHRPDCFGILGVAREIAGIQHKSFKSPPWYLEAIKASEDSTDKELLSIKNELPELVPRFMAQVIQNVQVKPSSLETQILLSKIGIRSINNVVDITNYLMYLTGQPLHAYDYDKLKSLSRTKPTIVIRKPTSTERLKVLGGKIIKPHAQAIMIATDRTLIGIGGVIGGADTEVDRRTKNIVLECANFDLYSIRRTSMTHGLFTDAVTRFSKGQSRLQNDRVLAYAINEIVQKCGGKSAHSTYDVHKELPKPKSIKVDTGFINSRLGLHLKSDEIKKILTNVEFGVSTNELISANGMNLTIEVPFWRTDIEIPEDIVEEVGRLYGYDHLPLELPRKTMAPSVVDQELKIKKELSGKLSALGANEVLTYSFVPGDLIDKTEQDQKLAFKLKNALSPDLHYYRLSLTPSLLDKIHSNIKAGTSEFALYEIGKTHAKSEIDENGLPKEFGRVCLVYANKNQAPGAAYFNALPWLRALLDRRFPEINYRPLSSAPKNHQMFNQMLTPFAPDRSALVFSQDKLLGIVGEYKDSLSKRLKLPPTCAGFELFLSIFAGNDESTYAEISKYPPSIQDISLKTEMDQSFGSIANNLSGALKKEAPEDVQFSVTCIDIFSKDDKHKQTAFRITASSNKRTLTTEVMNTILDKVEADLKKSINAERL